jgi:hypothetical protein
MAWAISAIIAGILSGGRNVSRAAALLLPSARPHHAILGFLCVVSALIACIFVAGGIAAALRRDWGRRLLILAPIAAIVIVIVRMLLAAVVVGPLIERFTSNLGMRRGFVDGAVAGVYLWGLLQIAYCGFLARFMSSHDAKILFRTM